MDITFAGAADTVTGSCHFVDCGEQRLVLDCGMFQGLPEIEGRNRRPFPFDPASVDWVLLSHAHLDHTGRLPMLVKSGFRGHIVATSATRDLARLILLDSARIQQGDAERARRKGLGGAHHEPLYDEEDVFRCLERFENPVKYDEPVDLGSGLTATFRDAGHVVGSAFIEVAQQRNGSTQRLAYSGDLGNVDKPIVRDPHPRVAPADLLLLESTYGQREHRPFAETVVELREVISDTFGRGGSVVIPSFALERAQELLYVLSQMSAEGLLGKARIYLDSPMAIEVTGIVQRHPECFDEEILEIAREGRNPFQFANMHFTARTRESKQINEDQGPCIIIAGSGMCTGGRILHHLRHRAPVPDNALVFIGYQAEGTTGREIVDGAEEIEVFDRPVSIRASLHTIGGFSGHAGRDTLLDWLGSATLPEQTVLVHGEKEAINALRDSIQERYGVTAIDADYGKTVSV